MKSWLYTPLMAGAWTLSPVAHAQTSVTLYGVLDNGLVHATNEGGNSSTRQLSGLMRGNRWGLVGSEELGGGLRGVFRLESGFSLNNGGLGQSTTTTPRIFGRYAYVGLESEKIRVLIGRQVDFMHEDLAEAANSIYGTGLEFHPASGANFFGNNGSNPSLDRVAGVDVDNSVKAIWMPVKSLSIGVMYGFGNAPGLGSPGSTQNYGIKWSGRSALLGVVYATRKDDLTSGTLKTFGIGGTKTIGNVIFNALFTYSKWTLTGDTANIYDVGIRYMISPVSVLGMEYTFLDKNNAAKNVFYASARSTYGVVYDYRLSKRTDIYAAYVFQHATGGRPAQLFSMAPSSNSVQGAAAIGIRLYF